MEVVQTNQEQKTLIETLCKEKTTFAKEYEIEFNRMSVRYYYVFYIKPFCAIMIHLLKTFTVACKGIIC